MSPIRVRIIGIGKRSNHLAPGAWGSRAHLPTFLSSLRYEIVALANSSIESAKASIIFYKLGPDVKAYGTPQDLANDPSVDLVVCTVVVTKHYELAKPSLLAGKAVFVEWPLAATTAQAKELTEIARSKKVKTIIGTQARAWPLVVKLKELIDSGKIGKVLSSTATGAITGFPSKWPVDAKCYIDINSGGNVLTIHYGHFLDSFVYVLGNFTNLSSILKVGEHTVALVDAGGNIVDPAYPNTTPDEIFVQGTLKSGGVASINYHWVPVGKTVNGTGVRWTIVGTKGEIEITTPETTWQIGIPGATFKIQDRDGEVQDVDFSDSTEPAYVSSVALPGTNTARVMEAFAKGEKDKYADFEDALEIHRLLDVIRAGHL